MSDFSMFMAGNVAKGDVITLTQKALEGYTFVGWFLVNGDGTYGERISHDEEYTFEIVENVTVAARYLKDNTSYMINVTAGGLGKVSVNGGEPQDAVSYVASHMEELTITVIQLFPYFLIEYDVF